MRTEETSASEIVAFITGVATRPVSPRGGPTMKGS